MYGNITKWDVTNVKNMDGLFSGNPPQEYFVKDKTIIYQALKEWDISNVETMSGIFKVSRDTG